MTLTIDLKIQLELIQNINFRCKNDVYRQLHIVEKPNHFFSGFDRKKTWCHHWNDWKVNWKECLRLTCLWINYLIELFLEWKCKFAVYCSTLINWQGVHSSLKAQKSIEKSHRFVWIVEKWKTAVIKQIVSCLNKLR